MDKIQNLSKIEKLISNISQAQLSGAAIYSSIKTLKKGHYMFFGTNPGNVPNLKSTVLDHFNNLFKKERESFNEYVDGQWSRNGKILPVGQHRLQLEVQKLFANLGVNVRDVYGTNLIFERSKEFKFLENPKRLALECWPFHQYIISNIVRPSAILTLGDFPYEFMKSYVHKASFEIKKKTGHGKQVCKSITGEINNQRIVLIKIPHLSRYSIKNYKEVIDWIKAVSAEKNETTLLN